MGLNWIVQSDSGSKSVRVSKEASGLMTGVSEKSAQIKLDLELLFGADDFGELMSHSRGELLAAMDRLLQALPTAEGVDTSFGTAYTREFRGKAYDCRNFGGGMGGLRIAGSEDYYGIRTGANYCWLDRIEVGADGRGNHVERIDIRDRDYVDTTNLGRIEIMKKSSIAPLVKLIERMRKTVEKIDGDELAVGVA
ncbi:MAG: hypothetical protein GC159_07905 [Phycisphaera sp.]|nr:hypothetical protein [Phycisphaera sp.]